MPRFLIQFLRYQGWVSGPLLRELGRRKLTEFRVGSPRVVVDAEVLRRNPRLEKLDGNSSSRSLELKGSTKWFRQGLPGSI
jgi:hypothetical protein